MTIDLILEKELKLFDKWKQQREFFCPDGIINFENYTNSKIKIMLLLKEANAVNEVVDFKHFLNNGAYERKATWENVLRWLYGIQNINTDDKWKQTLKGVYYYEFRPQKYLIDFVHPEVRVPPNYVYYLLIDTIREIRHS
ncbi:hypothetical protein [Niabella hirudinis]|uniref:hypothetical protein n=1 Tax=Niabella hirudinis TaxID=1285929 RepID=UPI003EBDBE96